MIRRGFWLVAGFGLGVAAAHQARRRLTSAAAAPTRLAGRVRRDVAGALTEGRHEMQAREARLRRVLAAPSEQRGVEDPGQ